MSLKKKGIAVFAAAALSVSLAGGVAYAWFAGQGAGNAAAATVDQPLDLVVTQWGADEVPLLTPGAPAVKLGGSINNPNPGWVHVRTLAGTVNVVPAKAGMSCAASNYVFTPGWLAGDRAPGNGAYEAWNGTLSMIDSNVIDQNGCKGAKVTVALTVK